MKTWTLFYRWADEYYMNTTDAGIEGPPVKDGERIEVVEKAAFDLIYKALEDLLAEAWRYRGNGNLYSLILRARDAQNKVNKLKEGLA